MKTLFRILFTAFCVACLSIYAMADVAPLPSGDRLGFALIRLVIVAIAVAAVAIVIIVIRNHRKK